jgi:hypothetical protein
MWLTQSTQTRGVFVGSPWLFLRLAAGAEHNKKRRYH